MGDQTYCVVAVDSEPKVTIITASYTNLHFGVDRSLYIVRRCYPDLDISRKGLRSAPIRWEMAIGLIGLELQAGLAKSGHDS